MRWLTDAPKNYEGVDECDLPHVDAESRASQSHQIGYAHHCHSEQSGHDGLVDDDERGIGSTFCVPIAECLDHYYNIFKEDGLSKI